MKPLASKAAKPRSLKILFADDEESLQELMSLELPRMGHQVTVCPDGLTAVAALERNSFDCLLVDIDMPGMTGLQVIGKAKELTPDIEAIVLTGKSSFETALAALRQGAFDYLSKPCRLSDLEALLRRVSDRREMLSKFRAVQKQQERTEGKRELVGAGPRIESVRRLIAKVAPTDSTVLILGETGTGKELVARALHEQSPRAGQPMVSINCGALPETLIESELFGHRKGAFTGADDQRLGLFEVAHGGTLFLDEIGELPKAMQAKLLRVLESGEIRRLGDNQSRQVDVRVLCATHRDLEAMVEAGEFREDLMFRINTFEITLPSLRERLEDIAELAAHLYRRFKPAGPPPSESGLFTPAALELLRTYDWPGNVRELANVVEHATILCERPPIDVEHLPRRLTARRGKRPWRPLGPMTLAEVEWLMIQEAIERNDGNRTAAAEELGISVKTLYNKMVANSPLEKSA
ncbi:MAG: Transcriptional regulatory protein ZraR [Planctomycetota bacterium]|jgi:DNA-binding NtrC family response regulator